MRRRVARAVLVAGLLVGALLPVGAPASVALPVSAGSRAAGATTESAVTARLAPPTVTQGESSGVVAEVSPVRSGRTVRLQGYDGTTWTTLVVATTDSRGRWFFPLATDAVGNQTLRVVAARQGQHRQAISSRVVLRVRATASCTPRTALVDPAATLVARCLATRLDRWRAGALMGVGQQLNVSTQEYLEPLTLLAPQRVSVVGFDLEEVRLAGSYEYPFQDAVVDDLLRLAEEGAVLSASWHPRNPSTGGGAGDRSWHDLGALLRDTAAAEAFWADYDQLLAVLLRLQSGEDGARPPATVVFRPLHEANGNWFWWGTPDPKTYRAVWGRLRARAAAAGVHNVVWAYSFNASTGLPVRNPAKYAPRKVDLGGLDSYDPERSPEQAADRFDLRGWSDVAPDVPRMAITEAGPHGSASGDWNPAVITRTVRKAGLRPLWAMLWFDDGSGADGISGRKQLSSLEGGPAWLGSCPNALCYLR